MGDLDAAQAAIDRALVLNGDSAGVLGTSGWVHKFPWRFCDRP
jgi:hypothetical protein